MGNHTEKITYKEVEFDVEFYYSPAEPRTHDHPGYGEEVEIESIIHKDTDFIEFLENDIDEIIDLVFKEIRSY